MVAGLVRQANGPQAGAVAVKRGGVGGGERAGRRRRAVAELAVVRDGGVEVAIAHRKHHVVDARDGRQCSRHGGVAQRSSPALAGCGGFVRLLLRCKVAQTLLRRSRACEGFGLIVH